MDARGKWRRETWCRCRTDDVGCFPGSNRPRADGGEESGDGERVVAVVACAKRVDRRWHECLSWQMEGTMGELNHSHLRANVNPYTQYFL